jgi:tetrahydromethanopterin S-methyltransferase subunit D
VYPVDPVDPVDPVAPVSPADPAAPAGPAGPGTGTATTAAGVTTVGLSHALRANAITTAENTIEYFIIISF